MKTLQKPSSQEEFCISISVKYLIVLPFLFLPEMKAFSEPPV